MKLWQFTFTSKDRPIVSARVAAEDRFTACMLLGQRLDRVFSSQPFQHPEPGTILTVLGQIDVPVPQIVSVQALA